MMSFVLLLPLFSSGFLPLKLLQGITTQEKTNLPIFCLLSDLKTAITIKWQCESYSKVKTLKSDEVLDQFVIKLLQVYLANFTVGKEQLHVSLPTPAHQILQGRQQISIFSREAV